MFWWTLTVMLGAGPVIAQTHRPAIEIGLGIGRVSADPHHEDPLPTQTRAAEIRLTLPFSSRFSREGRVTAGHAEWWSGAVGYYTIEVKRNGELAAKASFTVTA